MRHKPAGDSLPEAGLEHVIKMQPLGRISDDMELKQRRERCIIDSVQALRVFS